MVEVKTKFNKEEVKYFQKVIMRHSWWMVIFFSLFMLGGIAVVVVNFLEIASPSYFAAAAGGLMVGLCLFMLLLIQKSYSAQKKENDSAKYYQFDNHAYYKFDTHTMYLESMLGEGRQALTLPYSMLVRVLETQSHFLLFISNNKAHVIPKKDIVVGTEEELRNYVHSWVGPQNYKMLKMK